MIEVEDTKNIYLNSRHSTPNHNSIASYKSDVIFAFKGLLLESDDTIITHIEVVNCQIPYSFYNVNQYNSELNYFLNSNPNVIYKIIVPYGNYTITQLSTELSSLFLTNGVVVVITYNKITGRLLMTFNVDLSINTFDDSFSKGSSLYQILGFSENIIYSTLNGIIHAPFPANIIPMKKIRVCSAILSTNSVDSLTLNAVNIIASVPIISQPFSIIQYQNSGRHKSVLKARSIDNIDIQMLDQENQPLNFNNSDWSISLSITTLRRIDSQNMGNFNTGTDTILKYQDREIVNGIAQPIQPLSQNDTDLEFFMYQQGIYL
jgi:hypothetical protein